MKTFNFICSNLKKGRIFRLFFYIIFLLFTHLSYAESKIELELESTSYSESTSIFSIAGEWNDEVTSGSKTWSINRLVLAYQQDDFEFQRIYRNDFSYAYNNETIQFIHLTKNKIDLEVGKTYVLDVKPNNIKANGFRFVYTFKLNKNFNIQTLFSILNASSVLEGHLSGTSTAIATNDYDINFESDLIYEKDPLYGRKTDGISGSVYALDLIIDYLINSDLSLNLEWIDALAEIQFDSVYFTQGTSTSDTKSFDENGYVKYNPSIKGLDGEKKYKKKLEGRQKLQFNYQLSKERNLSLELNKVYDVNYQKIHYQQYIKKNQIIYTIIPKFNAAGIHIKASNYAFGIETDHIDKEKIKYLMLKAQFSIEFD